MLKLFPISVNKIFFDLLKFFVVFNLKKSSFVFIVSSFLFDGKLVSFFLELFVL